MGTNAQRSMELSRIEEIPEPGKYCHQRNNHLSPDQTPLIAPIHHEETSFASAAHTTLQRSETTEEQQQLVEAQANTMRVRRRFGEASDLIQSVVKTPIVTHDPTVTTRQPDNRQQAI